MKPAPLRTPTGMMATRMAMNPDRETVGARVANTVLLGERTELVRRTLV